MNSMELKYVDTIQPETMMEGDLIEIAGEIVEVLSIYSDDKQEYWYAEVKNDFEETETAMLTDGHDYKWYVYVEDPEEID